MGHPSFFPRIKFEKELKRDLAAEVVATPGGERIFSCLQCGTCGAACPGSVYIDYTPRPLIGMALGLSETALGLGQLLVPLRGEVAEKSHAVREPAAA